MPIQPNDSASDRPSLWQLFWIFTRIALTSFGGGVSGWMMRDFVLKRAWLTRDEFLSGLALSQALPGLNVVNLAIWVGYRLRGGAGAFWSAVGMVVPALLLILVLAQLYGTVQAISWVPVLMAGIAAAATGLSLEMGVHAAKRVIPDVVGLLLMAMVFAAIYVWQINLIVVIVIAAPLSVWYAYHTLED
ncbi:chromate transporter [Paenalcaligenes sp. Me131]|uniref:chromate transporter n=1 Tax=Paenalcaligenes sp. Me131 TaxID=3392636 RepID=UPI003D27EAE7